MAVGRYTPDAPGGSTMASFRLPRGVSVFGGFARTESSPDDRDLAANASTLSGDLNGDDPDSQTDNSVHLVTAASNAVLDGFVISGGFARDGMLDGGGVIASGVTDFAIGQCAIDGNAAQRFGGGIAVFESSVQIYNTLFTNNYAADDGGGLYVDGSSVVEVSASSLFVTNSSGSNGGAINAAGSAELTVTHALFEDNSAVASGGAVSGAGSYENVRFKGNESTGGHGGAAYAAGGPMRLVNVLAYDNSAESGSSAFGCWTNGSMDIVNATVSDNAVTGTAVNEYGAVRNISNMCNSANLTNSIVWGNTEARPGPDDTQIVELVTIAYTTTDDTNPGGTANNDDDPVFVDAGQENFSLHMTSPCIDAANGDAATTEDIDGYGRYDDPATGDTGVGTPTYVDRGAFEYQG